LQRSFEPSARWGIVTFARRNQVLSPLIAYTVGGLISLDGLAVKVLTLETSTASAVMSPVLATEFDTDVPFCCTGGSDDDVGQRCHGDGLVLPADVV